MFIDGIGIAGYRSFGDNLQLIGPFGKINLFAGQNNSGKSNILLFLKGYYGHAVRQIRGGQISLGFQDVDLHLGTNSGSFLVAFGLKLNSDKYESLLSKYQGICSNWGSIKQHVQDILSSQALTQGTDTAWFIYEGSPIEVGSLRARTDTAMAVRLERQLPPRTWFHVWAQITSYPKDFRRDSDDATSADVERRIAQILKCFSPAESDPPIVNLIPAIRRVGDAGSVMSDDDYGGVGVIERLARFQNPTFEHIVQFQGPGTEHQDYRSRFEEINGFLQTVTGNRTACLEVPHDHKQILVHMDGKTLPLSSMGTGIHEVIILATAATVLTKQVLCIEEPELHLHPVLQRKLIRYLHDKTDNQYFITTHSPSFLESPYVAVFHVRLEDGDSIVTPAYTANQKSCICMDLGYRPSDLLQANCIIWVEGPSDRIYLNYWIRREAKDLVEGIHYSVMFYGGRLLSHLSGLDPDIDPQLLESEIKEFISLRCLNRQTSILIDSDRKSETGEINATKKRIQEEFDKGPGFAWITQGREIENYLPADIVEKAVREVHPGAVGPEGTGVFDHCLHYKDANGDTKKDVDKVAIAREVIKQEPSMDVLDLPEKLQRLVAFIYTANGMDEAADMNKP